MQEYRMKCSTPLKLDETLFCGQVFRWRKIGQSYYGFIGNSLTEINLTDKKLKVISYNTAEESKIKDYFRFNDDLSIIRNKYKNEQIVSELFNKFYGLRIIKQEPLECAVSYITSIASNIKKIGKTIDNLSCLSTEAQRLGNVTGHPFPDVDQFLALKESDFIRSGMGFRVKYIINFQKFFKKEERLFYQIGDMDYREGMKLLLGVKGIGEKVADCILLFGFGKLEAFPVDRWIQRALIQVYNDDIDKTTRQYLKKFAMDRFGSYAGYVQQYLFHGIRMNSIRILKI
ncbi:MAG: hypothetical protein M1481_02490 [Candidatus Thermoplasmatota archaeon]|jgi:N-glycosylase/DNA lyase|nr:hypothetical protein [Candidatus Thermoplasmatota archaeon]MCL5963831.1 hypothetical protein [Candidatus Thermoplasmatota archaeon]